MRIHSPESSYWLLFIFALNIDCCVKMWFNSGTEHTYASRKPQQEAGNRMSFREVFRQAAHNPADRVGGLESDADEPVETFTPTQVSWCVSTSVKETKGVVSASPLFLNFASWPFELQLPPFIPIYTKRLTYCLLLILTSSRVSVQNLW